MNITLTIEDSSNDMKSIAVYNTPEDFFEGQKKDWDFRRYSRKEEPRKEKYRFLNIPSGALIVSDVNLVGDNPNICVLLQGERDLYIYTSLNPIDQLIIEKKQKPAYTSLEELSSFSFVKKPCLRVVVEKVLRIDLGRVVGYSRRRSSDKQFYTIRAYLLGAGFNPDKLKVIDINYYNNLKGI